MFERQLGLRENPFLAGHQPKYVYPSREHQEALAHLRYGIQNREPFVLITGEVGTGKTTAVYDALGEWGSRAVVALITNSALTRAELLEEICLRFGVAAPGPLSKPQALVQLERLLSAVHARGELAILLLDEAQNLDRELLEEIRLLSNLEVQGEKLIQIFLVGQPELESKLAQPELRQLRQRIGIHYRILPLSATETANYVHHRVAVAGGNAMEMFPAETCVEVFRITNGIPREINIVAGQALLNAFVEDSRTVTPEHVRSVEREIEFQSVLRDRSQTVRPPAPPAPAADPAPRREEPAPQAPRFAPPEVVREYPAAPSPPPPREPSAPAWMPAEYDPAQRQAPEPVASNPPAAAPIAADPSAPVLPSWFDEVVEKRRREDEQTAPPPRAPAAPPPAMRTPAPPPLEAGPPAYAPAVELPEERIPAYAPPAPAPANVRPSIPAEPLPDYAQATPSMPADDAEAYRSSAPIDFLTARLREKLEKEETRAPRKKSTSGWLVAAVLVAAVGITGILLLRFGPWTLQQRQSAPPPQATAPSPPPVDPAPQPVEPPQTPAGGAVQKPGVVPAASPPATGAAPVVKTPVKPVAPAARPAAPTTTAQNPKPAPNAGTSSVAVATPPRPTPPPAVRKPAATASVFGIAVGTFLEENRANEEGTSLAESTKLPAQVVTVAEDSVSMYRVVMGAFENRISAERMASDLVRRGLVNEARVVQMARATTPRP